MNYATIKKRDIANGPGVRVSLFVSGCTHHCLGCFNEVAWSFSYGAPFDEAVENEVLEALEPEYVKGLSLLGGEPFEPQNQRVLVHFLNKMKARFPEKTVWCYSGYTLEELAGLRPSRCRCETTDEMLSYINVLVDGRFEQEKKNIRLRFRGSENQRLIDLDQTREQGEIVLWDETQ